MKNLCSMRHALLLLCASLLSLAARAQSPTPFSCSGTDKFGYYISSATSTNTGGVLTYSSSRLSRLTTETGTRTTVCDAATIGVALNALAFNPNDNYLYAVSRYDAKEFSGKLYRLGENCAKTIIPVSGGIVKFTTNNTATVDGDGGNISSGTFDLDNNYYVNTSFANSSSTGYRNKIQKIKISGNSATVVSTKTLTCPSCPSSATKLRITDMIFDETTGKLYGSNKETNTLYSINAATGVISPVGATGITDPILGIYKNRFGAVRAIDATGDIYSVNLTSGKFTFLATATTLNSNNADAASGCYAPATISGILFVDANGLTDNQVNGTASDKAGSTPLFAHLVKGGLVVESVAVRSNGSFEFVGDFAGTYEVRIASTTATFNQSPPAQNLPLSHRFVGERVGSGTGGDGSPNGRLSFPITAGNSLAGLRFGIDAVPTAGNVTASELNDPGGTARVSAPALVVADAEDGVPTTITVVTIPNTANQGVLYYNGTAVAVNQNITNFQASLFEFDPVDGLQTVSFTYLAKDRANVASNTATVTMEFSSTLPLTLVSFTATYGDEAVRLHWETSMELDVDRFEVQRSPTGSDFTEIGRIAATGNSTSLVSYTYVDEQPMAAAYYRLVSVDLDGSVDYSNTVYLKGGAQPAVSVYPTLATDKITVRVQRMPRHPLQIAVFDATGKLVRSDLLLENNREIDVSALPSGLYTVRITTGGHGPVSIHKVMKR